MFKFLIFLLFVLFSQSDAKPRQKRLVNGITAEVGSFPFLACLRYSATNNHICGAAIISETFLITAAHCIQDQSPNATKIYAGSVDQDYGGTNYDIYEFIVHDNYTAEPLVNDIGLIRLAEPMRIGSNIAIIKLLPRHFKVSAGDEVTAVGWGSLHFYQPKGSHYVIEEKSNRLQYLEGTIISDEQCATETNHEIDPGKICLYSEDAKRTCYGDSGSPLVYTYGDSNFILGVVSWGAPNDCTPDGAAVSVYANVSHYLDWIHAHIKEAEEEYIRWGYYSNSKDEKRNYTENSNSEESENTHSKENTSNPQEAEETILSLKKAILSFKSYFANFFNSSSPISPRLPSISP